MIQIFAGDNLVASRQAFTKAIDSFKHAGILDIVSHDGKKITLSELQQATQAESLFGTNRLVTLIGLASSPQSKRKKEVLEYLKSYQGTVEIVLWEGKKLTTAQKRYFDQVREFPISKVLFNFLSSLSPGKVTENYTLFQMTIEQESVELIFVMIIRQIRLLIQIHDGAAVKVAPWQKQRLLVQAKKFSIKQLLNLHRELLDIDIDRKTGSDICDMRQNLDRLIYTI